MYDSEFNDLPNVQQYYLKNVDYETWDAKKIDLFNVYPYKVNVLVDGNQRRSKFFKINARQTNPPGIMMKNDLYPCLIENWKRV